MTYTDIYPKEGLHEYDGVEIIDHANDLPAPTNGTRQLEDETLYLFTSIVEDEYGVTLGNNSMLSGFWASIGGYVHVGPGPAITANGVPVFIDRMFLYAPGGQILDVQASDTTEFYMNKCALSNPAPGQLPNIQYLGTVDGFRVPTFEGCNFEWFNQGLKFDGLSRKIVTKFCPFRNVPDGTICLEILGNATTEFIKVTGGYFKDFGGPNAEVLRVDDTSFPEKVIKYTNNDHDDSVQRSSILNGSAGRDVVGVIVVASFPLADSNVFGSIAWDGSQQVTGSGAGPTEINVPTTPFGTNERVSSPRGGVIRYEGIPQLNARPDAVVTVTGVNDTVALRIAVNGVPLARPPVTVTQPSTAARSTVTVPANVRLSPQDDISVFIENQSGTTDVTIESFTLNV